MEDYQEEYQHFEGHQYFVGIDVSKRTLDVELFQPVANETHRFEGNNNEEGFQRLVRWLTAHEAAPDETIVCMENTGLYDDRLLEALTLVGYSCAVVKTTALKKVRPEHHRKDDRFDAGLLAEYAYRFTDRLRLWSAPAPVIEEIRLLYRERRRLVTQRAATKQLLKEASCRTADTRFVEALWQKELAFFDEQIERIEEKLDELVRSDPQVYRRYRQMKSAPGFGQVMSWFWVSRFFGEAHLDARRISSRYGFAPHARRSGTSQWSKGTSTGHGNAEMRKMLTLCARSAGTHYEKFKSYKARKLDEGKPSKLVTNNLRNKLIHMVCTMWNQDTFYDENHVSHFAKKAA